MASLEYILHQPIIFMHKKCIAIRGDNACGILTTMLQHQQTIIQQLIDWIFTYNAYNSAHV